MQTKLALVVGINAYRGSPLKYCVRDALGVAALLGMPEYGFDVRVLTDELATKSALISTLRTIIALRPARFLLYFAGHGCVTDLGSFLVTSDGTLEDPGVDLHQLRTLLSREELNSSETVVILDSCHAGSCTLESVSTNRLAPKELEHVLYSLAASRAVLAACRPEQSAMESADDEHGVFTRHLIEGLFGAAAGADGTITVSGLYDYLVAPFEKATGQMPVFRGDLSGRLILGSGFVKAAAVAPGAVSPSLAARQAKQLTDDYFAATALVSRDDYLANGYMEACQRLEPILRWFDQMLARAPDLRTNDGFSTSWDAAFSQQRRLGTLEPGTTLDKGEIAKPVLGAGAFGTVWRVKGRGSNPDLAYKVYHPQELGNNHKLSRFEHGYRAMLQLNHPRIVKVHEFTRCPLGFFMEYIEGPNLRKLGAAITAPDDVLQFFLSIADTVKHAHGRGVWHRDIKPENILLTYSEEHNRWQPHLTDFDLAWYSTATQLTKEALGTIYYAAPEQLRAPQSKAAHDKRVDIYSFGQLMYFCVCNTDPAIADRSARQRSLEKRLESWGMREPAQQFARCYQRCTEDEQDDRFPDFEAVVAELRSVQQNLRESVYARLTPGAFVDEVAFLIAGFDADKTGTGDQAFVSPSRRSSISMFATSTPMGLEARYELRVELRPHQGFGLEGISNDKARAALNARIGEAIAGFDFVTRKSGRQGVFELFLFLTGLTADREGVRSSVEVISRVVDAMERP